MFPKLVIIRIFYLPNKHHHKAQKKIEEGQTHLVKIIFIQLPYKTRKIRMLKHPREYGLGELVHVLHYEGVPARGPRDGVCERGIFQHPETKGGWISGVGVSGEGWGSDALE